MQFPSVVINALMWWCYSPVMGKTPGGGGWPYGGIAGILRGGGGSVMGGMGRPAGGMTGGGGNGIMLGRLTSSTMRGSLP